MQKELNVKTLGLGGAFDDSNSSFVIYSNEDDLKKPNNSVLFDCGSLIFNKIKKKDYVINNVFISHLHDDHIGSLMSLIYYNYYVLGGVKTKIYSAPNIEKKLKIYLELVKINTEYDAEKGNVPAEKVVFCDVKEIGKLLSDISSANIETSSVSGYHGNIENYGLSIKNKTTKNNLIISGDTKANLNMVEKIKTGVKEGLFVNILHDYSLWDNPDKNIHMCASDYRLYLDNLINYIGKYKFYFYHNAEANKKAIESIKI
jgi:ribonuclease BN (tRNA processing enzyme)